MENRLSRFFKIAIGIFTALLLGVIGGFIATAGAQEIANDTVVIETENYTNYSFYPDGYRVGRNGELVEFTGTYILTGEANTNVSFAGKDGESVTYNVILFNWHAYAQSWHGLLGVGEGVTLNLIVHGKNRIFGYNHPGIAGGTYTEEIASTVNITVLENSELEIGYQHEDSHLNIHQSVGVTLNSEATSSLDMSSDSWRSERNITFSRGSAVEHVASYTYVDDSLCRLSCGSCEVDVADVGHKAIVKALEDTDENASTKHSVTCANCKSYVGLADHVLDVRYESEANHTTFCEECGFVTSTTEHNRGESGCADCDSSYIASVTVDGETTNYFEFISATEAVKISGGELKLLGNVSPDSRIEIMAQSGNVTVDLNGFLLETVVLRVSESSLKLTVIDSSEKKTGVFRNNSGLASDCGVGTIEYNGITIDYEGVAVRKGKAIFNNVRVDGNHYLEVYVIDPLSRVEFTDVYAQSAICVRLQMTEKYDGNVKFNSGEYQYLEIDVYADAYQGGIGTTFIDMLPQGYAFADENGIVNCTVISLYDVKVVEHSEHVFDKYLEYGYEHIVSCICGMTKEGEEPQAHTLGQDGLCVVCGIQLKAMLSDSEGEKYFSSVEASFGYANGVESANIKLLCDAEYSTFEIYSDITLDLNGYTLKQTDNRIYIRSSGKLTVCDTSEEQTGLLAARNEDAYIVEINTGGSLVVNSGSFFGMIYKTYSGDGDLSRIEINGGKFTAGVVFTVYDGTAIVINGGLFEGYNGIFQYLNDEGISITLNGGAFVNSPLVRRYSFYIPSVSELLGKDDQCQLVFVDERGNEIELNDITEDYEGRLIVAHKGAELATDENEHGIECPTCQKVLYSSEHHSFIYGQNEADKSVHTVVCGICDYDVEAEKHTGGTANCTELAVCELCENEYGLVDSNNHTGGDASCNILATCDRCKSPYGEYDADEHTSKATKLVPNGDKHDRARACCGEVLDSFDHKYDSICDTECNECKGVRTVNHEYGVDGKCISCGTEGDEVQEPQEKESDTLTLGTGAIVGTIIGTVVLFGGITFAVIWFVIKKKKWSDLFHK